MQAEKQILDAGFFATFVPLDLVDTFCQGMDAILGDGACHILSIRPQGGVEMIGG